jgi:hypothetical protein
MLVLEQRVPLEKSFPAMFAVPMWFQANRIWEAVNNLHNFLASTFVADLEEVIYCPMCNYPVHARLEDVERNRLMMRQWVGGTKKVHDAITVLLDATRGGDKKEWCWELSTALEALCR